MTGLRCLVFGFVVILPAVPVSAQQVTTRTPFTTQRNSFFEQMGMNFGFGLRGGNLPADDRGRSSAVGFGAGGLLNPGGNIRFNQAGFAGAQPQFGNFQPGSQSTGGFRLNGGNASFDFGFSMGQGSSQTRTSQTPFVTTMNGQPGMFADQVQRPFILGITPVVNHQWAPPGSRRSFGFAPPRLNSQPGNNPVLQRYRRVQAGEVRARTAATQTAGGGGRPAGDRRRSAAETSSAEWPAVSVAEIHSRQAAADLARNEQAVDLFQRGLKAEREGKLGPAKVFFKMAAEDAVGQLKTQAQASYERLTRPAPRRSTSDR
ncbi:MAG: hypothetical protein VX988_05255 [Planctomycetota bacterium]|nr:hypothetical protein [Planctomycetota bacterium]